MHREGGRVDVSVCVDVGLLGPGVGAGDGVLHRGLDVHHLEVGAELLLRHAVPVEAVLADEVRVQVGRHARAWGHLHVLHGA